MFTCSTVYSLPRTKEGWGSGVLEWELLIFFNMQHEKKLDDFDIKEECSCDSETSEWLKMWPKKA